jgi:hypothetical protein
MLDLFYYEGLKDLHSCDLTGQNANRECPSQQSKEGVVQIDG